METFEHLRLRFPPSEFMARRAINLHCLRGYDGITGARWVAREVLPAGDLGEESLAGTFGCAHLSMAEELVGGRQTSNVEAVLDESLHSCQHSLGRQFG